MAIDQFEEFRKFFFYIELMVKAFNKLNEKSQKGIKELKVIYGQMMKNTLNLWKFFSEKIINANICEKIRENEILCGCLRSTAIEPSDKEEFIK